MPRTPTYPRTVCDTSRAIAEGAVSARQVVESCLTRIDALNPRLNAFVSVDRDEALRQAERVDACRAHGDKLGPLAGVPLALKDNLCTVAGRTTCGSAGLAAFESIYDAHVVTRLREAGAIILGKTNLDEFGMGSSTEHSIHGPTRNPWDPERTAGGSSGGSAAAVASGCVSAALGTDTGGSIRQPAAFCGVTGLKPTYGRVSRYGLVAFASSLDQIGPITRDVRDAALLLNVIAQPDARDSTCTTAEIPDYLAALDRPLKGLRIGVCEDYFGPGLDDEVRPRFEEALDLLESEGARRVPVELPHLKYGIACYYIIAPAEASSNLARYDGVHFSRRVGEVGSLGQLYTRSRAQSFGAEVKRRIMLGTFVLSRGYHEAYYLKALKVRTLIRRDFERAFGRVDVIASPVAPTAAFRLGTLLEDPLAMYLNDVYTATVNLAGLCGLSVPCGFTRGGLPVGLQLIGPPFGEESILAAGHQFQLRTDYHLQALPAPAAK